MSSLLNSILFGQDANGQPQTPNDQGLTDQNKFQLGASGIAQLGALIAAAGQPMSGAQRAQYLGQLGNVGQSVQEQAKAIGAQRLAQANTIHTGQETQNAKTTDALNKNTLGIRKAQQDMIQTPEFQALPLTAQAAKLAALGGDPASLLAVNKAQMPVQLGNGTYIPGVGLYNQYTHQVTPFAPGDTGKIPGNMTNTPGPSGTGVGSQAIGAPPAQSGEPATVGGGPVASSVGIKTPGINVQALSQVPEEFQDQVRQIATGDDKFQTGRYPADLQVAMQQWVHAVNPNFSPLTYENRQKFLKDIAPSGKAGVQLANAGTALDHGDDATNAFNDLNNTNFKPYNALTTLLGRLNPMGSPALTAYDTAITNFLEEGKKAVQGKAITEGERQQLQGDVSPNMTPAEFKAKVGTFNELMARRAANTISGYHMSPDQVRDANESVYNHLYGDNKSISAPGLRNQSSSKSSGPTLQDLLAERARRQGQ